MLVCRVVGGLCRVVDTNEFDADDLSEPPMESRRAVLVKR